MLPGGATDLSPPSTAEVENEWSFISTLPPFLQSVYRDKFSFTFYALWGMLVKLQNRSALFGDTSCLRWESNTIYLASSLWPSHYTDGDIVAHASQYALHLNLSPRGLG